jgi:hypothetical protein
MVSSESLHPTEGAEILSTSKSFLFSLLAGAVVGLIVVLVVVYLLVAVSLSLPVSSESIQVPIAHLYRYIWKRPSIEKPIRNNENRKIPFILIQASDKITPSRALYYSLEKYRQEISQAVQGLSHLLEKALALEENSKLPKPARLSTKIEERIKRISKCLEDDAIVLQGLLQWFNVVTALPDKPCQGSTEKKNDDETISSPAPANVNYSTESPPSTIFQMVDSKKKLKTLDESNAYDSAAQIVAHVVRDWTSAGALIRRDLYDWCRIQLDKHFANTYANAKLSSAPVLVPGAGMGRLAYDLYQHGYTVEANEISLVMATAANSILQRKASGAVHPFALDHMSNEVDSNRRYDSIHFPDTSIRTGTDAPQEGSLSFTIGDFVGEYFFSQVSTFGAVVTCFFIDTATNIYEYIELIEQLLKPGGVWVNVGPVQWLRNALLRPSVDELKDLISFHGFDIVHWKVDSTPVPYQQDDSSHGSTTNNDQPPFIRTTNFDAYRPLRFVAIRRNDNKE